RSSQTSRASANSSRCWRWGWDRWAVTGCTKVRRAGDGRTIRVSMGLPPERTGVQSKPILFPGNLMPSRSVSSPMSSKGHERPDLPVTTDPGVAIRLWSGSDPQRCVVGPDVEAPERRQLIFSAEDPLVRNLLDQAITEAGKMFGNPPGDVAV